MQHYKGYIKYANKLADTRYWVVYKNFFSHAIMTVEFSDREHARIIAKQTKAGGFWRIKALKS